MGIRPIRVLWNRPDAPAPAELAATAEDEEEEEPPKLKRGPWSAEEDQRLLELVQQNRSLRWVKIAKLLGTRTSKQCRERYHQNLKPSLNHRPITEEEGKEITRLVGIYGKRWAAIARHLQGRSDNTIKNWWNAGANRRRLELNSQLAAPPGNGEARSADQSSIPNNNDQQPQPQPQPQQPQQQHQPQLPQQQQQYLQPHAPAVPSLYPMQMNYGYTNPGYQYYQVPGQHASTGFVPGSQFYQVSQQQPQQQQYMVAAGQYFNPENVARQQAGAGPIYMTMPGYSSQLMMPMQPQAAQVQMPAGMLSQSQAQVGTSPAAVPPLTKLAHTPQPAQAQVQPPGQPQASQSELSPGSQVVQTSPVRRISDALSPTQVPPEQRALESALGSDAQQKQPFGSLFKASYAESAQETDPQHHSPAVTVTKPAQILPGPMSLMGTSHAMRHRLSVDHSPYRRNSLEELSRRSFELSSRPSTPDSRRSSVLHSSEFQRKPSTSWAPPDSSRRHSAVPEMRQASPRSSSALPAADHLDTPPPPAGSGKAPLLAPPFSSGPPDPSDRSRRVSIANLMSD
ncbi:Myb-like DNA-binding protein myb-1 [Wickerhamiella sorbophila]|uniref:Myb-like DNA-binding protein myb-1 n=1 Tax=Wickerhamiella sorbophila TaxID=45607 RepID=A0A2T0FKI5_9ASCO|nr:Myb-like DNA-binding protein myb-1 [Wickerhamiella sorbophila]PRT55477.1 Myb-like DNA-binding protein myb-1 [Wickerhamiella sorbophila]